MSMKIFTQQNLTEVATSLDVHPFDIARMYGQDAQGLPKELTFSSEDRERIAEKLGLEFWWTEKKAFNKKELLILLAQKLLAKQLHTPTRGDNLYRGLEGEAFQVLRSAVNVMIDLKILKPSAGPFGIIVSKGENFDSMLKSILDKGEYPPKLQALVS